MKEVQSPLSAACLFHSPPPKAEEQELVRSVGMKLSPSLLEERSFELVQYLQLKVERYKHTVAQVQDLIAVDEL